MSGHNVPQRRWLVQRWGWGILAAFVTAAVGLTGVWWHAGFGSTPALIGTVPNPPIPTYDFRLTDQDGRAVALSGLRGRAVVLTFLYVHCPDVCPVIADNLHRTDEMLGTTRRHVVFVAVSVDPSGDTPAAAREFLTVHHVRDVLEYLTGSYAQLKPIWTHYYVESDASAILLETAEVTGKSPDRVGHTAIVYLIDPTGGVRAFLSSNFAPQDLATDIRIVTADWRN